MSSPAERQEQYDSLYLSVLQREGTLPAFFDTLFSFLMRRTDFYYQLTETGPRDRGFPPGAAHKMVVESFRKHEAMFKKSHQQQQQQQQPKQEQQQQQQQQPKSATASAAAAASSSSSSKPKPDSNKPTASSTVINKATGELAYSADPECYNGAARDGYTWSQSIGELDIRVDVRGRSAAKGSDIRVDIGKSSLRVKCRSSPGSSEFVTVLDRQLCYEVRAEEAVWSLVPSDAVVQVSLEKVQERWWDACFVGEEKINTREIDCSRPITDLDEEAQAKIDQMMFDQRQKQLGMPTSEEAKTLGLLRKAWDAEGSPYKGTPFDPSVISNQMPDEFFKQQQQQ